MKSFKNIASMALIIPMLYMASGCKSDNDARSSYDNDEIRRQYPIINVEVPAGKPGTLDSYLRGEKVADRVSYDGISKVLREANRGNYEAFHSGKDDGWVILREGKRVNMPDYNFDGKAMGIKGEPTDLRLVIYKGGPSIEYTGRTDSSQKRPLEKRLE
jgi:hypothetical protein